MSLRIGIDIGGTSTDGVLLDGDRIVSQASRPTGRGTAAVTASADAIAELLLAAAADAAVHTIGVGIPGTVSDGVVRNAVNLDIAELDLGAAMTGSTGLPVAVENDVKAAALGAWRLAGDDRPASLAYLNLGTGLAAGIVLDGRLLRGRWGAAGEIGHILVDPAGPVGSDGQPGGLEAIASGSGLARQWPSADPSPVRALAAAADAGDADARRILQRFFEGVAGAVRILVLSVDVERIVIGGGLTSLGDRLITEVGAVLAEWQASSAFLASMPLVERIRIADRAVPIAAIGAAWLGETSDAAVASHLGATRG